MHISEFVTIEKTTAKSQRNDLMNQIYSFYLTDQERVHNKKYRLKLYQVWLKENKYRHTMERALEFKKTKTYKNTKGFTPKTMACFFLSHVKTKDLFYVLSVAKDKYMRNESVGMYIKSLSNFKEKKFSTPKT